MMLLDVVVSASLLFMSSISPTISYHEAWFPATTPTTTHHTSTTKFVPPHLHTEPGDTSHMLSSYNVLSLPRESKVRQASQNLRNRIKESNGILTTSDKIYKHSLKAYVNYYLKKLLESFTPHSNTKVKENTYERNIIPYKFCHNSKKEHLKPSPGMQYIRREATPSVITARYINKQEDLGESGQTPEPSTENPPVAEELVSPRLPSPVQTVTKICKHRQARQHQMLRIKEELRSISLQHESPEGSRSTTGDAQHAPVYSSRNFATQKKSNGSSSVNENLIDSSMENETNIYNNIKGGTYTNLGNLISDRFCIEYINGTCIVMHGAKFQSSKILSRKIKSSGNAFMEQNPSVTGYRSNNDDFDNYKNISNTQSFDSKVGTDSRQSNVSTQSLARGGSNVLSHKGKQHSKRSSSNQWEEVARVPRRTRRRLRGRRRHRGSKGLSLWIDSKQVKTFSGYVMEIFVIHNSRVLPYILDPNFEGQLPVIPAQVEVVNFTWRAGSKQYTYTFDHMYSQNENLLAVPVLSLPTTGRVPRKSRVFSVEIRCTGNASGVTTFGIGLSLHTHQGNPLPGTPLRLKLRKECSYLGPDPVCDERCDNGGVCDEGQRCVCAEGYMGPYCSVALCYPRCMNGGTCTSPGRCSCLPGFNGRHCEGGICQYKCQNGGKCIQKDTCECRRGYYGNQCEFSKCVIPCINGGRCRDVNKCRCPHGFAGNHCEVMLSPHSSDSATPAATRCHRRCRHGSCRRDATCRCHRGFTGRWCRRRGGRGSGRQRKKVWI